MAKREPKKTLKDKKTEGLVPKKIVEQQKKGEVPNYIKNKQRAEDHERLAFAKKIADAKVLFPKILQGIFGRYLVGINRTVEGGHTVSEAHTFTVRNHHVPEGYGRAAYDMKVIEGDVKTHEEATAGVSIPLSWIFKYPDECNMQEGAVGEIQMQMLLFLQEAMQDAIFDQKEREAETKATKILDELEKPSSCTIAKPEGIFLATRDGKNVTAEPKKKPIMALYELVPGAFGCYNFNDQKGNMKPHCMVEYFEKGGKTYLRIKKIHSEHCLALEGVEEGFILQGINLNKDKPISETAKILLHAEHYRHLVLVREFFLKKLDVAFSAHEARKYAQKTA